MTGITKEQANELRRLIGMLRVRVLRRMAVQKGVAGPAETPENTQRGLDKATAALEDFINSIINKE